MKLTYTLAIVTKNRPRQLSRCLKSTAKLSIAPQEIIVVDNSTDQTALPIIKQFSMLHLKYIHQPKNGIPHARNAALDQCRTPWLGFIDDDCVIHQNWAKQAAQSTKKYPKAAFIAGHSVLLNPKKFLAQVHQYTINYWQKKYINPKSNQLNPLALDTKNVLLNYRLLEKNGLIFDQRYATYPYGGWADTDLGLQIKAKKLKGYYNHKMIVAHQENTNVFTFVKKSYYRGRTAYLLAQKWGLTKQLVALSHQNPLVWLKSFSTIWQEIKNVQALPPQHKLFIPFMRRFQERIQLAGFVAEGRFRAQLKTESARAPE